MTADHLRLILESEFDTRAFCARVRILPDVVVVFRMAPSQLCRSQGSCSRRLVVRTIAQKITPAVLEAMSPFQFALGSKAGGESVAHAIQSLTDCYFWTDENRDNHVILQEEGR